MKLNCKNLSAAVFALSLAAHSHADNAKSQSSVKANSSSSSASATSPAAAKLVIEETLISKPTPAIPQGQIKQGNLLYSPNFLAKALVNLTGCALEYTFDGACSAGAVRIPNPDFPQPVATPTQDQIQSRLQGQEPASSQASAKP